MAIKPKIIEREGERFVLLPLAEFERLWKLAGVLPEPVRASLATGEHRIRAWRRYRGMTQQALARAAGIARPYLTEIETGRKPGSVESLRAIATALGLALKDVA